MEFKIEKKRISLLGMCLKTPDPIKAMNRHLSLIILTTEIPLVTIFILLGVMNCDACDLTKPSFDLKFMNSHADVPGGFFLSDMSVEEEQTVPHKSRIFRSSYEGPPYVLEPDLKNNLIARLWRDFNVQARSPFKFARFHPVRFGLAFIGLGALIATDHKTLPVLAPKGELEENGLTKVGKSFSKYGEAVYAMPIIVGFGAYGWLAHSPREKETFFMVTEALATSSTWTSLLKVGCGRERPSEREASESDWTGPFGIFSNESSRRGKQFTSFPSGHSSAIWSIATILAYQYPRYYIVPILGYSIASAVAYSRMVVDAHWLSDVVVGSALGYLCARQVLRDNPEPGPRNSSISAFNISFDVSRDYYGIRLHFRY
ncbi:MAG: phosphatase PAP2 family protein [Candidatus Zixiibacteriota bacterium]